MTDNTPLDTAPPTPVFAPLGEALSAARTSKKLSQQDISNHLRFSVKQVDALESNQFEALPDAMITRGFIRNYARYLGLDAEPLLESYKARVPTKSPSAVSVQSSMYQVMSGKDSQPWLKYILGSILILLLLLAWIFYIDYMPKNSQPASNKVPEAVAPNTPTEVQLPEIALPPAEREAETENAPGALNIDPAAIVPDSAKANASPGTAAALTNPALPEIIQRPGETALAQTPSNSASVQAAAYAATPPAKTITLSVTEKTWINVTDKSGKVVYERILAAGSADALDAEPPLNVVVGNAKATSLLYKGQPVNLASNMTGNNVARIKLE